MEEYDPMVAPDPEEWLRLDEDERMMLAADYHERKRERAPNPRLHAVLHAIVENQVAMGDEAAACDTLARLMSEGLHRHDAVHAIASVLAEHMFDLQKTRHVEGANERYNAKLRALTADGWLKSWEDPDARPSQPRHPSRRSQRPNRRRRR